MGFKYPPFEVTSRGLVAPLLLVCLAGLSLWTGWVWTPARSYPRTGFGTWYSYRETPFWGAVCLELSFALALFGYYYLANDEARVRFAGPVLFLAGLLLVSGFAFFFYVLVA